MQSIGLPKAILDQINTMFFKFLWKKKCNNKKAYEKVKRKVLCNNFEAGGLRMVDVHRLQDSILLSWAEALVTTGNQSWKNMAYHFFKEVGGKSVFLSKSQLNSFKGMHLVKSPFWRSVLTKWLEYSDNCKNSTTTAKDPIFNNKCILFKNTTLFFPSCIQRGILTVNDVTRNGRMLSFDVFRDTYGDHPRCILDYNAIANAIRNISGIINYQNNSNVYFKGNVVGNLGRKSFYSLISGIETPLCTALWDRKYGVAINKDRWNIVHQLKETRLKVLSWKLLHNIYPTNILLFKMKLSNTENCKHCKVKDYIEHFFFSCEKVKPLWKEIEKDIQAFLGVRIVFDEATVLLGALDIPGVRKTVCNQINHLIAVGKVTVSKFKYGKGRNILEIYETESRVRKIFSRD